MYFVLLTYWEVEKEEDDGRPALSPVQHVSGYGSGPAAGPRAALHRSQLAHPLHHDSTRGVVTHRLQMEIQMMLKDIYKCLLFTVVYWWIKLLFSVTHVKTAFYNWSKG